MNFPRHVTQRGVRVPGHFFMMTMISAICSIQLKTAMPCRRLKRATRTGRPAGEHDFVTKDGRRVRYSICGMATKNDIKVGADKTLHLTAIPPALRNSR